MAPVHKPLQGIGLNVLATMLFAVETLMMKWLTADYPVMQVLLLRSIFALIPSFLLLRLAGGIDLRSLMTQRPGMHFLRVASSAVAMISFYTSITMLPLADAVGISFSAPLFMAALAIPILGERVGGWRWVALAVGFSGVLLMIRPGGAVLEIGAAIALLSSVFYAVNMIITRKLGTGEPGAKLIVYSNLFHLLIAGLCMITRWETPPLRDLALMASVGLIAGFAQFALVQAYRSAAIATVAPFDYVMMIWAAGFGFVIFAEVPNWLTLLGALVVAVSNLAIVVGESRWRQRT
ncbi:MAG: DMT family transporter [Alphaproteobacteria bacterium]|nr:DMT family transporter [Alphaproteobacteria bacterium]